MKKEHILGFGAAVAIVFFIFMAVTFTTTGSTNTPEDIVYQSAPFSWLMEGQYDGTVTYGEILEHGDTGLGTFDKLDGEMVLVDGTVYQVKTDGTINTVSNSMTSPFAEVTYFDPDIVVKTENPMNYSEIKEYILEILPSNTTINTIRLDGSFSGITTRSVPEQEYPYRPLEEILPEQTLFNEENVEGTAAGFWHPDYMDGANAKGYHLHFISSDREFGGHLLDFTFDSGVISIDGEEEYVMNIPWEE